MTHDLPAAVSDLLRRAPGNWSEVPRDLSQTEQEALAALTAAGFVERRVGFSIRLPGQEQNQRITIELSGEYGLAEAMAAAVQDWWARWGRQWKDLKRDTGEPIRPVVTRDADYWRLTADGLLAKTDLAQGSTAPIDFVLKRGFFDGRPRLLADGRTVRREPVRGYGKLVSIENAPTGPLAVNVANAPELAEVFARAFEKVLKPSAAPPASTDEKQAQADEHTRPALDVPRPTTAPEPQANSGESGNAAAVDQKAWRATISIYSGGVADDRLRQVAAIVAQRELSVAERLQKIDDVLPIPASASLKDLAELFGVSREAVRTTPWWQKSRAGERKLKTHQRRQRLQQRAKLCPPDPDRD